jgi:hypothetical protein
MIAFRTFAVVRIRRALHNPGKGNPQLTLAVLASPSPRRA